MSLLDRPSATSTSTSFSRAVSTPSPARGARISWVSRRVTAASRKTSSRTAARSAASTSAGPASLSRYPDAPLLQRGVHPLGLAEAGQDHHPHAREPADHLAGGRHAVHPRHLQVHQDDVGQLAVRRRPGQQVQRLLAVTGLAGHLDVLERLEVGDHAAADDGVVVHDQDPDRVRGAVTGVTVRFAAGVVGSEVGTGRRQPHPRPAGGQVAGSGRRRPSGPRARASRSCPSRWRPGRSPPSRSRRRCRARRRSPRRRAAVGGRARSTPSRMTTAVAAGVLDAVVQRLGDDAVDVLEQVGVERGQLAAAGSSDVERHGEPRPGRRRVDQGVAAPRSGRGPCRSPAAARPPCRADRPGRPRRCCSGRRPPGPPSRAAAAARARRARPATAPASSSRRPAARPSRAGRGPASGAPPGGRRPVRVPAGRRGRPPSRPARPWRAGSPARCRRRSGRGRRRR